MRDLQARGVFEGVSEQYEIEVERSGSARKRPVPPVGVLEREKGVEELAGIEKRVSNRHGVEIKRLVLETVPNRFGLDRIGQGES
jgi:hypothetical protein